MTQEYALSIKQPWAALLLHGIKTIEIRRWPTARRGRILLHAARIPDDREQGWSLLPAEAKETAQLQGGIIGAAELTDCLRYTTLEAFQADQAHHLNDPAWFLPPRMFGFRFTAVQPLPFRRYPGNVRFFPVRDGEDDKVTR